MTPVKSPKNETSSGPSKDEKIAGTLSVADMRANVALSEEHVRKQEAIIARLTDQGHEVMAVEARALLELMHVHLGFERGMLARMEAGAPSA